MSYAPGCYKGFRERLKTQERKKKKNKHRAYVGCRVHYFGGPFAGLITYTCKNDESYFTAQSTILQLTKNIK